MLRIYGYIASGNINTGYQNIRWNYENGIFAPSDDESETIRRLINDGSVDFICARTPENTVFFLQREIIVDLEDRKRWYMNLAFEADAGHDRQWQKLCLAFLTDRENFAGRFAETLFADDTGVCQADPGKLAEIMIEQDIKTEISEEEIKKIYPGADTEPGKKLADFIRFIQKEDRRWDAEVKLLVPMISLSYYNLHCQAVFKNRPELVISRKDWVTLTAHQVPEKDGAPKDRRKIIFEKKDIELLAYIVIIAVWAAGRIISEKRRLKKKKRK